MTRSHAITRLTEAGAQERMIEKTAEQAYETARLQKRNVKMVRYEHLGPSPLQDRG